MNETEHIAKPSQTPETGFVATLRGRLPVLGAGAPKISLGRVVSLGSFVSLCALFGALVFTAVPALAATFPTVTIKPVGTVTSTTAQVSGTVNPNGSLTTTVWNFQYSKDPETEGWTPSAGSGIAIASEEVTGTLEGLQPDATYQVRLVATNEEGGQGVSAEPNPTFKTQSAPPAIDGESASEANLTEATLEAQINPNNQETQYTFEIADNEALTGASSLHGAAPLSGFGDQTARVSTGGILAAGETYFYRVVAMNAANEQARGSVEHFTTPPTPDTDSVTDITDDSAMLNGHFAQNSEDTRYDFNYKAGPGSECSGESVTAPADGGSGAGGSASAQTKVTGLAPDRVYAVCLVTINNFGAAQGTAVTFRTLPEAAANGVEGTSAELVGQLNSEGSDTHYHFEYGNTTSYGASTETVDAEAGSETVNARALVTSLVPETEYHYRLVTVNAAGERFVSADQVITTARVTQQGLPDGRAYELVSPNAASDSNVYVQRPTPNGIQDLESASPFRAAADGQAVAFVGEAPPAGGSGSTGEGLGDEFKAIRTANGWSATDIMAPRRQTKQYDGFSSDLAVGALTIASRENGSSGSPLTPDAPANCDVLYLRTAGDEAFHAGFTSTQTPGECGEPVLAGISADDSHVIFESNAALVEGAQPANENLYMSSAGHLSLVNVLPDGEAAKNATFGISGRFPNGVSLARFGSDYERAISPDGSRIVWTDLDTEPAPEDPTGTTRLFVRENADSASAKTVQVDAAVGGGGQLRGASSDDSLIYFTKNEHLYEYDLESATTTDLTPDGGVVGVVGVGEDGDQVYFVAGTVLATNANANGEVAKAGSCELPEQGLTQSEQEDREEQAGILPAARACNLYTLRRGGSARFIAVLLPHDGASEEGPADFDEAFGDWAGSPDMHTAELSQDGTVLAFTSKRSLTGYDNNSLREIFVYDAATGQLACASCNPSQEPAKVEEKEYRGENYPPIPDADINYHAYQYRWVSANGGRVFFDTNEGLVPQDTNGEMDVYEWERAGEGSCGRPAGCIYLISGDASTRAAYFSDASESGDDVFFTSRADLVPEDEGENVVLYDARVGGGFSHTSRACTGTGCQGVPPAAPSFATPASVTFSGEGVTPVLTSTSARPKTAAQLRAERLAKALKACQKRRSKKLRASCGKQARRRYGSVGAHKATTGKKSKTSGDKRRAK